MATQHDNIKWSFGPHNYSSFTFLFYHFLFASLHHNYYFLAPSVFVFQCFILSRCQESTIQLLSQGASRLEVVLLLFMFGCNPLMYSDELLVGSVFIMVISVSMMST